MKKFVLVFLLCVMTMLLHFQSALAHQSPVAVIMNYSDLAGRLTITRSNGTPDGSPALLYPGDKITGDISSIKLEFAPYADFYSDGKTYIITYKPPSGLDKILTSVEKTFYYFWDNVEKVVPGISRGSSEEINLNPQPGFNVTVFSNQPVIFSWDESENKIFSIKDDKENKIFEQKINGVTSIEIIPANVKLKAGQKYIWNLEQDFYDYQLTVLDENSEKIILSKLAEIDSENISANEKILKKATYAQLISDIYSDKIDLYWLSAQWLMDFNPVTNAEKKKKEFLLGKCKRNLDSKM